VLSQQMTSTEESRVAIAAYREKIIDEIGYALGVGRSGAARRMLDPLFRRPAERFGRIAARADTEVRFSGLSGSARKILPDFSLKVSARGEEWIPQNGPLLLASNHPGALDSLAILSCLPRDDTKVLLSDVGFTRAFTDARRYFIFVAPEAGCRIAALRASIDYLQSGGAVLIFPHGDVEPDPEMGPGASLSLKNWSRSVEIMLQRVPESWLQVAIVSGVLARKFVRNPIVKIRKDWARKQKLAEVIQLSWQVLFPRSVRTHVHITFSRPIKQNTLAQKEFMPALIKMAGNLLEDHLALWDIPSFSA